MVEKTFRIAFFLSYFWGRYPRRGRLTSHQLGGREHHVLDVSHLSGSFQDVWLEDLPIFNRKSTKLQFHMVHFSSHVALLDE